MRECLTEAELRFAIAGRVEPGSPEATHLAACRSCRAIVALACSGVLEGAIATDSIVVSPAAAPTSPTGAVAELARGQTVGRFLIVDRLGSGAMGVVYSAYDTELDRRIAIKILHTDLGGDDRQGANERATLRASAMAEAQAMARLAHPNVIRVYDVGEHEGALFIAMELVEGTTLAAWLAAAPRPWREVLAMLRSAGAGLAAAHDAGLVHRDFKPANVLVRRDGHVFVTDFGLARGVAERAADADRRGAARLPIGASHLMTHRGVIVGTPSYMAPEVLLGEGSSVASDIYSFGVSAHEALTGELPYRGRTLAELSGGLARDVVAAARERLPRWLRREVARAMSPDPAARHPSMRALNDALGREGGRWWRRGAIVVALVVALVVGLLVVRGSTPTDPCAEAGVEVEALWNAGARERVRASFEATGRPSAGSALALVSRGLDDWQATYRSMERDRCRATIDRTQPEALLARRVACMQRRRLEAAALLELLGKADARLVERARDTVEALDGIESCGDLAALAQEIPLPTSAQQPIVDRVRADLAQTVALAVVGQTKTGIDTATRALEAARASGHLPSVAESWFELGRVRMGASDNEQAEAALHEALWGALVVHDDQLAVKAALQIAHIQGNFQARFADARWTMRLAEALISRLGGDKSLEATLYNARGAVAFKEGAFREAVAAYQQAIVLRQSAGAARWLATPRAVTSAEAVIRGNLGNALAAIGDFDAALAEQRRALEIRLTNEGPSHPSVATSYNNIGFNLMERFEPRAALPWFQKGLALRQALLPPDHMLIGLSHANVGMALAGLGDRMRALEELERGLGIMVNKLGHAHLDVAAVETELAAVHLADGDLAAAAAVLARAFAALDATAGREHMRAARTLEVDGDLRLAQADAAGALAAYTVALAISAEARPGNPALVGPLVGIGQAHLALGEVDQALLPLEEALARSRFADRRVEGDGAFALARAYAASGEDGAEIAALIARARAAYIEAGTVAAERSAALARWEPGAP